MVCAGGDDGLGLVGELPELVVAPEPAAAALVPKILLIIFPKMLICTSRSNFVFEDELFAHLVSDTSNCWVSFTVVRKR